MKKSNPRESPDVVLAEVRRLQQTLLENDSKDVKNKIFQMTYNAIAFRRKAQWEPSYETLLKIHLQVGVESLVSCEETLKQYRNKYQQTKIESLRDVLLFYVDLGEKLAEKEIHVLGNAARRHAGQDVIQVDLNEAIDEELQKQNEELVRGYEGQFQSKVLAFVWGIFKSVFVVLRNNGKLNHIYAQTVARAIEFCKRLQRTKEFKDLCDTVRKRLPYVERKQNFDHALKLKDDKTITELLCTRLALLNGALAMGMHQEAYKIIMRDINEAVLKLAASQRIIPSSLLYAQYYLTIAKVFWICERHLLHACSIYKAYVQLTRQPGKGKKKKPRAVELPDWLETRHGVSFIEVVLSTLIVPEARNKTEIGLSQEMSTFRLALTFAFPPQPTRQGLLSRIANSSLLTGDLRLLYDTLETGFDPMNLCDRVDSLLNKIEADYQRSWTPEDPVIDFSKYRVRIVNHAIVKMMSQLSRCYKSIPWSRILEICSVFLEPQEVTLTSARTAKQEADATEAKEGDAIVLQREAYLDEFELEDIVVNAVQGGMLSLRIDHRSGHIFFHDLDMESGLLTNHMVSLATKLSAITRELDARDMERKENNEQLRENIFGLIQDGAMVEVEELPMRIQEVENARMTIEVYNETVRQQEKDQKEKEQKKETDEKQRAHQQQHKLREQKEKQRQREEEHKQQLIRTAEKAQQAVQSTDKKPKSKKVTLIDPAKPAASSWAKLAGNKGTKGNKGAKGAKSATQPPKRQVQAQVQSNRGRVTNDQMDGTRDDANGETVEFLRQELREKIHKAKQGRRDVGVEDIKQTQQQLKDAEQRALLESRRRDRQEFDYWVRAGRSAEQPKVQQFIDQDQSRKKRLMKLQYKLEKKNAEQQHRNRLAAKDRLLNVILPRVPAFLAAYEEEEQSRAAERRRREEEERKAQLEDQRRAREAEQSRTQESSPPKRSRAQENQRKFEEKQRQREAGGTVDRGLFGRGNVGQEEAERPRRRDPSSNSGGGGGTLSSRSTGRRFGASRKFAATMDDENDVPRRRRDDRDSPRGGIRPTGAFGGSSDSRGDAAPPRSGGRRFINSRNKDSGNSNQQRTARTSEVDDQGFITVTKKKRKR